MLDMIYLSEGAGDADTEARITLGRFTIFDKWLFY